MLFVLRRNLIVNFILAVLRAEVFIHSWILFQGQGQHAHPGQLALSSGAIRQQPGGLGRGQDCRLLGGEAEV